MFEQLELKHIELKGFKSIDAEGQAIELGPITVLLGANGAGKSNLVSFFRLLNYMARGGLQQYVAGQGFADALLYMGAKVTTEVSARLRFENLQAENEYAFILNRDATGRLFLKDETIISRVAGSNTPQICNIGGGVRESQLTECREKVCQAVFSLLSQCRVFQFHDTSATAKIRSEGYVDDARFLKSDGANLAAFLRQLCRKDSGKRYYDRIVRHIQLMVPQFLDFDLEPLSENDRYVRLNWREKRSDYLLGPHQLSDGSLRFMALTTLFMQPPNLRPKLIIVDEPELGLHPAAISALAGMVKAAASTTQIILATQSSCLVDQFSADHVLIVERDERQRGSLFRRLSEQHLVEWLERYSLSELWEKNVLGGRP